MKHDIINAKCVMMIETLYVHGTSEQSDLLFFLLV